ncbi:hypothetical protein HK1_00250 [Tepidibacillus sp. HK-1]|nr:hypothetical protein HK1_00250 [Tepidibacillus sp. HK-1]
MFFDKDSKKSIKKGDGRLSFFHLFIAIILVVIIIFLIGFYGMNISFD